MLALLLILTTAPQQAAAGQADDILSAAGVKGGLVVHVGCGDGKLTAALRTGKQYLVHGLDTDADNVAAARRHIRSRGLYGKVAVRRFDGTHLPYTDNLVNLLVADGLGKLTMDEVMRVLAPNGVAMIASKKTVKPRPKTIDEWTHYLGGPDNNAVSRDRVVGIPFGMQWVGGPKWARHHNHLSSTSAMVTAGGRLFAILDEGAAASLKQPPRWRLVARDAFNGVVLWKREVGPWEGEMRPFRSGPTELARRLVAAGDRVYATLGYGKCVTALDAATGRTVRIYEATKDAVEIVHAGGVLYVVAGTIDADAYDASRRRGGPAPPPRNKRIMAVDAETGKLLWRKADDETAEVMPTTLCVSGAKVFFQSMTDVVCADATSGKVLWRTKRATRLDRRQWSAPTLVVRDGVVLSADCAATPDTAPRKGGGKGKKKRAGKTAGKTASTGQPTSDGKVHWRVTASPKRHPDGVGELIALSASDGRELWRCPTAHGYTAPADVFIADGLVWTGTNSGRNEVDFAEGRDLHSGKVVRKLDTAAAFTHTHHHRCYRNKATDRFILLGRTGVELIDLAGGPSQRHCWVRGACQYGVMPANGLLYTPPHACGCYIQSKLSGLWALAPRRTSKVEGQRSKVSRVEKGPAYGKAISNLKSEISDDDWATYRGNNGRTGRTSVAVPAKLTKAWTAEVGGRLSGVVVAGGTLLVASIDTHTVHALDAGTGKAAWQFTAGGRIDSPPTIHEGMALFGAADGFVYCLRLTDGALVWRFRAAPADRQTVAFGQVESVWPVTGSVLVRRGVVYCTAGRSSFLDGGMVLHRLEAATGKLIGSKTLYSRDLKTGAQPEAVIEDTELPGALPDVLVDDGTYIYLRDKRMSPDGTEHKPTVAHLYSSVGLLDDYWWHRTYWSWGQRNWGRASGWAVASMYRPSGRILVTDDKTVFGYGRKSVRGNSMVGYHLFRADKQVQVIDKPIKNNNVALMKYQKPAKVITHWSQNVPLVVRAMVLADDVLLAAGPPFVEDQQATEPAFGAEGRGVLMAFAGKDGQKMARYPMPAQPVFDGMAVARGRLYVSMCNGHVACFGEEK